MRETFSRKRSTRIAISELVELGLQQFCAQMHAR